MEKERIDKELAELNDKIIKDGMHQEEFKLEKILKEEIGEILKREKCNWRQKSREIWLQEGDRNTKLLNKTLVANRSKKIIVKIKKDDGSMT